MTFVSSRDKKLIFSFIRFSISLQELNHENCGKQPFGNHIMLYGWVHIAQEFKAFFGRSASIIQCPIGKISKCFSNHIIGLSLHFIIHLGCLLIVNKKSIFREIRVKGCLSEPFQTYRSPLAMGLLQYI